MDIVGAPHIVRGTFRLLNTLEGLSQLATLLVACAAVRWIRSYTLRLSVRRASAALTVAFLFLVCYYVSHLEKQGITNRRRFVAYTPREFTDHVAEDVKMIERYFWSAARKPSKYGNYRRLNRVSQQLLTANQDLPGSANRNWSFVIVRSMAPSAFVLPNCRSYFFEGLFRLCENDDTLSFVVAHEMAHCLLDHTLEKESLAYFLDRLNTLVWISSLALIRGKRQGHPGTVVRESRSALRSLLTSQSLDGARGRLPGATHDGQGVLRLPLQHSVLRQRRDAPQADHGNQEDEEGFFDAPDEARASQRLVRTDECRLWHCASPRGVRHSSRCARTTRSNSPRF
ncbi:hypothetical protein MTO96_025356 [Rhipicephalus appendiculatus]